MIQIARKYIYIKRHSNILWQIKIWDIRSSKKITVNYLLFFKLKRNTYTSINLLITNIIQMWLHTWFSLFFLVFLTLSCDHMQTLTQPPGLGQQTPTYASHSKFFKINAHGTHTDKRACTHTKRCYSFIHSLIHSFSVLSATKIKRDLREDHALKMTAFPFLSTSLSHSW